MNKKLIPVLLLLASSASYAQDKIGTPIQMNDKGLPPVPKSTKSELPALTNAQLDFLKLPKLPTLPPPPPNVIYDYTVSVDRVTKDNPSPIRVYSSNGSGTDTNINYFSNHQEIPYVKECIKEDGKELKCSYDNLRTGFGYSLSVSKPYSQYSNTNYEVTIEIGLSDLIKWRGFEGTKIELPEIEILNMKKTFAYSLPRNKSLEYKFEKKKFVFKSSEYAKNNSNEEYIFTLTIEPTYKPKKEIK
jgi:hypothetical protein